MAGDTFNYRALSAGITSDATLYIAQYGVPGIGVFCAGQCMA